MQRLSSSLRSISAEASIANAKLVARDLGITRVTDVTWLDKIGIPVFSGIRPYAAPEVLCVHAGKGMRAEEAKIGAYMESIEFALADYRRHMSRIKYGSVGEIISTFPAGMTFPTLCPQWGYAVGETTSLCYVEGREIFSGNTVRMPADLVFHPFQASNHSSLFGGTNTNGLCSGNTEQEAIIHGICEVLERDVISFNRLRNESRMVTRSSEPDSIRSMRKKVEEANLSLILRYTSNEYDLPFFSAYVLQPNDTDAIAIADGFGLHPIAEVAAVRAVAEAVQSRLSHIHGGRDDIIERVAYFETHGRDHEILATSMLRASVSDSSDPIDFEEIPSYERSITDLDSAMWQLRRAMQKAGFEYCVTVPLSEPDFPFSVIRVVIPGAEHVDPKSKRVGPRFAHALASQPAAESSLPREDA
ncbi:YcaO-like family protein [Paraburkholderia megapolitana]|uniref:Ribosomal protein S12 methylthiotransferase accessory factor n=1 Tax=Paraburkholderia megapolitana TaxID=420953 RepID=A0A1I3WB97_9BURK|nr:YcaO-like family protein [Paraburkholderia megapolitana]QDQ82234.1 hypothetical protein FNZ07_13115 [Paraburkholderia megapolitana]SFK04017.1 ribosomal protein S12 methylthiotransferase accessory factor [Paraburkholderia megapolitana]